jgi:hypothetical protein
MMAPERKSAASLRRGSAKKARPGGGQSGRSDRWPSDYGRREAQEKEDRPLRGGRMKASKALANVDEQGDRANVRQNTPPKGLRNKR